MAQRGQLTFCWWNVHNFAHFDAAKIADARWPKSHAQYEEKRERVVAAFRELFGNDLPDVFGVCEITRKAAADFASTMLPDFELTYSSPYPHDDEFQVAVFYRSGIGFSREPPLVPTELEDITEGTRPMIPVHFALHGHVIRFVACHWTAFDTSVSQLARQRLADVLRRDTYEFLEPEVPKPGVARHVVVLGDLNDEPTSAIFEQRLIGRRDRESSHTKHWRDTQVRRVRLYNAAWRFLGEQFAHGAVGTPSLGAAGTYFKEPHEWRTLDHVLVSCGLLGAVPPYFDEAQTRIVSTPIMRSEAGLPRPFAPGTQRGVSDHLPIVGRIILPETLDEQRSP